MQIEYWFLQEESIDVDSRTATIERLLAELEIKDEQYIFPPPTTSKLAEVKTYTIRPEKVQEYKNKIQIEESATYDIIESK